ncbi:hypothetical protein [Actinocrispum sp. NPDC049592]|uniref:hypothetical protein n=1 Tax=Actinocrispum sp. NPDC049592 TaxID=3154835 RepID=UPI0034243992
MADSRITIIATPDPDVLQSTIGYWTGQGLLRPSVWVDPSRLDESPTVMGMPVQVIGPHGRADDTELREVFGDAAVSLVRVMAVQQVVDDTGGEAGELVRGLWDFADRLTGHLAQATVLQRINLVIPNDNNIRAKSVLEPNCDLNVVVSPEDRPHESAINHGLDRATLYEAHSALACATVGALWRPADTGAFDQPDDMRAGRRGGTVVTRSSARVIDGRHLPDEIINRLLDGGTSSLAKYQQTDPNQVFQDERLAAMAANWFREFDEKALSYREPERQRREPPKYALPKTFGMLMRFFAHMTRIKLLEWREKPVLHLEPEAESWLFAQAPAMTASAEPMMSDELRKIAAEAPDMRVNPAVPMVPPVYPRLWPPLRQLCFGLVDGGPLPMELREDLAALSPTVGDAGAIAASPDERFKLSADEKAILHGKGLPNHDIRPGDSGAATRLESRLDKAEHSEAGLSKEERKTLADCRERLGTWKTTTHADKSLVGQLVKHVDGQLDIARKALKRRGEDYDEENKNYQQTLAALDRITNRLWRQIGLLVLLAMSSVGWLTLALIGGPVIFSLLTTATTAAGLVWLAFLSTVAAEATALEQELDNIEERRKDTVAAVRQWPTETQRLGGLYEVLLDWGEIIGYLLHQPFGATGAARHDNDAETKPQRPEAFKLGAAEISIEQFDQVAVTVVRDVFTKGWIGRLYDIILNAVVPGRGPTMTPDAMNDPDYSPSPPRYEDDPNLAEDETPQEDDRVTEGDGPFPDKDRKPDRRPAHARDRLLFAFRTDVHEGHARSHFRTAIHTTLLGIPPEQLFAKVRLDKDAQGTGIPADRFFTDILPKENGPASRLAATVFSDAGRIGNREVVANVHLWGRTDHLELATPPNSRLHVHPDQSLSSSPENRDYLFSLIRLDVSDGCDESDLVFPS